MVCVMVVNCFWRQIVMMMMLLFFGVQFTCFFLLFRLGRLTSGSEWIYLADKYPVFLEYHTEQRGPNVSGPRYASSVFFHVGQARVRKPEPPFWTSFGCQMCHFAAGRQKHRVLCGVKLKIN